MSTITVTIPMCPDADLSPNARCDWRRKAAAAKALRNAAGYIAKMSMWSQGWETATGPVTVRATIGWAKGRKRHDGDNIAAMLKPAWDGLTDAGVWQDDKLCRFEPVAQERDKSGVGFVVIDVIASA